MLEIENHGRVREIRLARAPVNALNPELADLLITSLRQAQTECDAIVLSGQPGIFSAGLDVVELLQLDQKGMTRFWASFFELLEIIACSRVPIAVAITGHSPAGGAVMCLFADYRVMSRGDYLVGLNEARVGLTVPPVLQAGLGRLVGPHTSERMVVSGTLIDPETALEAGLVDALETGYENTVQHAVIWCTEILKLPRHSMLGNRTVARLHFKQDFAGNTAESIATFVDSWFSKETQYALNALVAQLKRKK